MKFTKHAVDIYPYPGGNKTIDSLANPNEKIWVVNAKAGRRLLIMPPDSTEEDAWGRYEERFIK